MARAPLDLQPAGHDAVHLQAPIDTAVHRIPDGIQAVVQRFGARPGKLGPLHLGNQEARACDMSSICLARGNTHASHSRILHWY